MEEKNQQRDVSDKAYIEQEKMELRLHALGHGTLFYRGVNFLLVPLIAIIQSDVATDLTLFSTLVVSYLIFNFWQFAKYFRGLSENKNWLLYVLVEAIFISGLCFFSGGFESPFKFIYAFSVIHSSVMLRPANTYITASIAVFFLTILYAVGADQTGDGIRNLIVFDLFLAAISIAAAELAIFVNNAHRKTLNTVIDQVRSGRKILEQHQQIEEQNSKFRLLIETVNAVPWEYDAKNEIFTYIGPQVEELLGYTSKQWITERRFLKAISNEKDHATIERTFSNDNQGLSKIEYELQVRARDKSEKWLLCSISPNTSPSSSFKLHGMFFDITKRKKDDEELNRYRERLEEMVQERTKSVHEYADQLEKLTTEDTLTGIPNRRYFDREFDKEWRRALRRKEPLGLLMIDVDEFKKYNDHYGHIAGDNCLRMIATTIQSQLRRAGDFVARYGGEEFIALVPGADQQATAMLASRILAAIERLRIPHQASTVSSNITITIGVSSVIPEFGLDGLVLVSTADKALYEAKNAGRNRFVSIEITRTTNNPSS